MNIPAARLIFAAAFADLEGAVTVADQARAAYTPSNGLTIEQLEARIRIRRGLAPTTEGPAT